MTQPRGDKLGNLASALRMLAATPVADRTQLNEWYSGAARLKDRISADPEISDVVPHFVWHYLADADIRLKDSVYSVDQNLQLMDIVHALERGEVSESGS